MAQKLCQDCQFNIDGYCHSLPPREQKAQLETEKEHDAVYYKYPQVIPTAAGCVYFAKKK